MKIGIDLIEIDRIQELCSRKPDFLARYFSEKEINHIKELSGVKAMERIAGKFAAKEAYSKAYGTGLGGKVKLSEIEILPNDLGVPMITLLGETKQNLEKSGYKNTELSIAHSKNYATAVCIIF